MNLETKLNGAVDDILRSAGFIFEVINHNKRNSNLILGPNTHLVSSTIVEQLLASLSRFDSILDETVSKFNDTRWCIDQILESKHKQEELRLKEEEEKRKKLAEEERIRREQEEKAKREQEAKEKKLQEEAAAAARQKLEKEQKKRLEDERIELEKRKNEEEEANKKRQKQEDADNKLGFDTGFNFLPGFDFNMDDFGGGLDIPTSGGDLGDSLGSGVDGFVGLAGNKVGGDSATESNAKAVNIVNSGNFDNSGDSGNSGNPVNPGNSGNSGNPGSTGNLVNSDGDTRNGVEDDMYMGFDPLNSAPPAKQESKAMDEDMNTLLGTDTLLLDGLNMDLYEGDNLIGGAGGEEEFDVDSFLNQFGGAE